MQVVAETAATTTTTTTTTATTTTATAAATTAAAAAAATAAGGCARVRAYGGMRGKLGLRGAAWHRRLRDERESCALSTHPRGYIPLLLSYPHGTLSHYAPTAFRAQRIVRM